MKAKLGKKIFYSAFKKIVKNKTVNQTLIPNFVFAAHNFDLNLFIQDNCQSLMLRRMKNMN